MSLPENYAAAIASADEIPAANSLIESGLEYPDASPATQEALATFIKQIPKMDDAAFRFQGWRFQRAMMNSLTTRISQVLNDELDVDGALARIKEDVDLAMNAGN